MRWWIVVAATSVAVGGCAGEGQNPLQPAYAPASSTGYSAPVASGTLVQPLVSTEGVAHQVAAVAILGDIKDVEKSLVLVTDRDEKDGSLNAYDLEGKLVQRSKGLAGPVGVAVEQGVKLGSGETDLVVVAESKKSRLLVYRRDAESGKLVDVTGSTTVFGDAKGLQAEPTSVDIYRRPADGALYAIVSRRAGPAEGYLGQYRLVANEGKVDAKFVRTFGQFSGRTPTKDGEVTAVSVDDAEGAVYYADERKNLRRYPADPDAKKAGDQQAVFGADGFKGARSALAVYAQPKSDGFIVAVDSLPGGSELHLHRRTGKQGEVLSVVKTMADTASGVAVTSAQLGTKYPFGLLVVVNTTGHNVQYYDWRNVTGSGGFSRGGGGTAIPGQTGTVRPARPDRSLNGLAGGR
ncbi:MAG: phytase [Fimbriimonadaceae bacterium]|nr:phytase [Fimbriimonadaceae bacterium]